MYLKSIETDHANEFMLGSTAIFRVEVARITLEETTVLEASIRALLDGYIDELNAARYEST